MKKRLTSSISFALTVALFLGALQRLWDIQRSKEFPSYQGRQGRIYPV